MKASMYYTTDQDGSLKRLWLKFTTDQDYESTIKKLDQLGHSAFTCMFVEVRDRLEIEIQVKKDGKDIGAYIDPLKSTLEIDCGSGMVDFVNEDIEASFILSKTKELINTALENRSALSPVTIPQRGESSIIEISISKFTTSHTVSNNTFVIGGSHDLQCANFTPDALPPGITPLAPATTTTTAVACSVSVPTPSHTTTTRGTSVANQLVNPAPIGVSNIPTTTSAAPTGQANPVQPNTFTNAFSNPTPVRDVSKPVLKYTMSGEFDQKLGKLYITFPTSEACKKALLIHFKDSKDDLKAVFNGHELVDGKTIPFIISKKKGHVGAYINKTHKIAINFGQYNDKTEKTGEKIFALLQLCGNLGEYHKGGWEDHKIYFISKSVMGHTALHQEHQFVTDARGKLDIVSNDIMHTQGHTTLRSFEDMLKEIELMGVSTVE